jgi:predicted enzyme related to lactoylglutathione lyase
VSPGAEDKPRVFRVGGVSYLRIPAKDPGRSAAFYEAVFGGACGDPDDPSFEDGTGHVIGHFMTDLPVAGEAWLNELFRRRQQMTQQATAKLS